MPSTQHTHGTGVCRLVLRSALLLSMTGAACLAFAHPARIYGLNIAGGNRLVSFYANAPGTLVTDTAVSGLAAGEVRAGIDFRPATGELYGVATPTIGSNSRVVKVDPASGAVTTVGAGGLTVGGTSFGIAFHPVADRIRLVSNTDMNIRLNPISGALSGTDDNLAYVAGDPAFGANPNVTHIAHTNQYAGAATTTVYGIDTSSDALVRIGSVNGTPNSPNLGGLTSIGPLGVDVVSVGAFDIEPGTNIAYAALRGPVATESILYTINLATGAATAIGPIGTATTIDGIAIALANTCLDLDGDGRIDALTDGLMLLRAQFGLTGASVTNGAIATPAPPRATWAAIRDFMNANCGTTFGP